MISLGPNSVGTAPQAILDKTDTMDKALRHLAIATFKALLELLRNSHLYLLEEGELNNWLELTKCIVEQCTFPSIFRDVLSFFTGGLRAKKLQALTLQVGKLNEGENGVARTVQASPNFITLRHMLHQEPVPLLHGTFSSSSVLMGTKWYPSLMSFARLRKKA